MRAVLQTTHAAFFSSEFPIQVGTIILAVHIEPLRVKIIGMIDNTAIPDYDFEAKLLLWARAPGKEPAPITYGGKIHYGQNDFMLDPALRYDFASAKLAYLGPDDQRIARTRLLGFE